MISEMPHECPACQGQLVVTRLECGTCGTEVTGAFQAAGLGSVREPHASLLGLFLRTRGNVKEMERELGLSYPTVRARLEEALTAAGFGRASRAGDIALETRRSAVLDDLERGAITAAEAADRLRELNSKER